MTISSLDGQMDAPDYTAILDNLYIGNLSTALTLRDHPELGITHVLSVCPNYPEKTKGSDDSSPPSVQNPRHRCIAVEDSEYEDILSHLPAAVAFIRDALEPSLEGTVGRGNKHANANRVLVHCVMGISRSATIICAYLMATRGWSPAVALMFVRKRRPQAHPNFGFRRQLAVFADCRYFADYTGSVKTHPAYTAWLRRRKREAARYLSRVDNIIEVKIGSEDVALSMTEDFPTDPTEAASLLSEIETTHFLTISPASMPTLPPAHPPATHSPVMRPYRRPPIAPCAPLSRRLSSTSSTGSGSEPTSALSSRSSSFSHASSSAVSTPATSVASLQSLIGPSKLGLEVIYDSDDEVEVEQEEPTYLELAGVRHRHMDVKGPAPEVFFLRLSEAASFIRRALDGDSRGDDDSDSDGYSSSGSGSDSDSVGLGFAGNIGNDGSSPLKKRHVLIHCKTESRACLAVCAYLMSARRMSPSEAYGLLEKALPLFNVTRTFVAQLELFRACNYNPTPDHPSVSAWIGSGSPAAMLSAAARVSGGSSGGAVVPRVSHRKTGGARWKCESDAEGEGERDLRRKIGTPARCGSFSIPGPSSLTSAAKSTSSSSVSASSSSSTKTPRTNSHGAVTGPGGGGAGNVDDDDHWEIDALLTRCAGVGDPGFVFDVEAFRSALRGISGSGSGSGAGSGSGSGLGSVGAGAGGNESVADPGAGAKRKGGAG